MQRDVDVDAAVAFVAGHGRVLDRRRLDLLLGGGDVAGLLAALDGYGNPDGGYGWGIEPDLRARESQPVGAMHALEVLAEVAESGSSSGGRAVALCDWLEGCSLADGGLPFALPVENTGSSAPFWVGADHGTSSLQMTAQVAANAQLVARHDPEVAAHPWLARATAWCLDAIGRLDAAPHAYELLFAVRFLDVLAETDVDAAALLERMAALLPADGVVPVAGGAPGEALRPLDLAPRSGSPARRLFAPEVIDAELDRLAGRQQADGGWTVDFESYSPAAALEWRGYATVGAVSMLR